MKRQFDHFIEQLAQMVQTGSGTAPLQLGRDSSFVPMPIALCPSGNPDFWQRTPLIRIGHPSLE